MSGPEPLDLDAPTYTPEPEPPTPPANAGGSKELLALALPLVISQSFMTVQVLADTFLLARHDTDEMTASFPAVMWYWLGFGFLSVTAGYTSTFVAQYTGAGRPHRVGPAVWQGIYFSVFAGLGFLGVVPLAGWLTSLAGHPAHIQELEAIYLRCFAFAALPMLVMQAINGFFSGRGDTWTVLLIEAFGTAVNVALALVLIFGRWGFPEMGIAGAGVATVVGSWAAAGLALVLFLRPKFREAFATAAGWRFDRALFGRLMKYGGPAGMQVFLDVLVFHLFTQFVGKLGDAALGATTLTIRFNMVAFLPMMGIGQAVSILVGQRLGGDRPDLAEKTVYTGTLWSFGYMCIVAAVYLTLPQLLVSAFEPEQDAEKFAAIADIVPSLLVCVAVYSLADAVNLTFAFALRGAGDTRFVTWLTFALAWPVMVLPTAALVTWRAEFAEAFPGAGDPLYWAWGFATAFICCMAVCFVWRFRTGKWKTMRVIEPGVAEE
ncbi:MAG TPA: MATE family efflux transporter [Urbifossiella sp.]|nr:MATE family efflux transporter [Urbifossiella sp.]